MSEPITTESIRHTDSGALYGKPGLDLLQVQTSLCRAVIAKQGGQLLEFHASGRAPLLWLSPKALFEPGKSVRGGIPLCLPWFGINRTDASKPKHGLVRTEPWELAATRELPQGEVELVFTYQHPGNTLFSAPFSCEVTLRLGTELRLHLHLKNRGEENAEFSWAWHSYFPVNDIGAIEVHGLAGCDYLDNTRELRRCTQEGVLTFPGEVDRAYENAPAQQQVVTVNPIQTRSENCHSVIAWNPGAELAATLADVGDHYREYVCVEHGNAFANSWQLASGETAEATLRLKR